MKEPPEDGGRWTGPKIALWMAAQLGAERVHPQRGWEALKAASGCTSPPSCSRPRARRSGSCFARQVGAGCRRHIVLVLDNAGWHGAKGLAVPDGFTLAFLPPYSPELQPAERLWPLADDLDATTIRPHTSFH